MYQGKDNTLFISTMASKATTMQDKKALLKMLHKASPKLRRALLADLPPEIVQLLSECALNILKGTITLSQHNKDKLKRYRKSLHALSKKNTSVAKKKKIIQTGGFLPAILGGVLPALIPAITEIVKAVS